MRIAVFNQKGGVGKTTTTLNLAAALSRQGRRTLMIDLDPQAHLTAIHSEDMPEARASAFALYQHNRPLAELAVEWSPLGWLIPAHAELIKVDSLFGKGPNILNRLNQGLNDLTTNSLGNHLVNHSVSPKLTHETTLIDCCPFLGVLSLNAVFAADRLLVPVSSDFLSLRGAQQIERTLRALEPVLKRRMERRYLLTRFDRRRRMCAEIVTKMKDMFGNDLCTTVISENVSVAESPSVNQDVFTHAPSSRGAQDYAALLTELQESSFL